MQFKWQLANAPKYAMAFDGSHWIIVDGNELKDSDYDSAFRFESGKQTCPFDWQFVCTHFPTSTYHICMYLYIWWQALYPCAYPLMPDTSENGTTLAVDQLTRLCLLIPYVQVFSN